MIFRINGDDFLGEYGITAEVARSNAKKLEMAGADAISVASGLEFKDSSKCFLPMTLSPEFRWRLASAVKQGLHIPVIASGGLTDPRLAEKLLQSNMADLVGFARPLLADPDFISKAKEGKFEDIRPGMRCGQGCLSRLLAGKAISWLANPAVGREAEAAIRPSTNSKNVLVIGGGPAGMEAAIVAAQRGHKVTLFEKAERLGGQFSLAAVPPGKNGIGNLVAYLERQARGLGVEIKLNEEATVSTVETFRPDVVVVAQGAVPAIPRIPGASGTNVLTAADVLNGRTVPGNSVIVVGGGQVGCEVADFLSGQGKKVTVVAMLDEVCRGINGSWRHRG